MFGQLERFVVGLLASSISVGSGLQFSAMHSQLMELSRALNLCMLCCCKYDTLR